MRKDLLNITLVIPPWTILNTPHLGVHLLQASAPKKYCNVFVFYADQLLAKKIGIDKYKYISEELVSQYELIQERLFAKIAYPTHFSFLGNRVSFHGIEYKTPRSEYDQEVDWKYLFSLEDIIEEWVCETAMQLAQSKSDILGFTISHQQTNAAISLINKVKEINPLKIIIAGGSNCDGEMANGILSLSTNIDYVFSGKSEISFADFIINYYNGILPKNKIVCSSNMDNLDDLPLPNYDDYFRQIRDNNFNIDFWLNVESSRGCWWGWKNQCKFCGVNGNQKKYQSKSPQRIYNEIKYLKETYNVKNIRMVDTLMPRRYFDSFIPMLQNLELNVFYEQRADIGFEQMQSLKKAGVNSIQIGIESLATSHLELINKGVTVADNINSLRYSMILDIYNGWNLLYNIPNEDERGWEEVLKLLPYIKHLPPPTYLRPVELARFSPYHASAEEYKIKNIKYFDVYKDIYPPFADINSLAWLFEGDFQSISKANPSLLKQIDESIKEWILSWKDIKKRAYLTIWEKDNNLFLIDTRKLCDTKRIQIVNIEQVSVALIGSKSLFFDKYKNWALENKVIIEIEDIFIPLATSSSTLFNTILINNKNIWKK